ncbi:U1 small nuclear ribonucleoprotein 70 kDa [Halyomorpha halys]|uniref:U1 small nuclear ribonucleoprotein 70 kDa n=1 Tax=Halyomorpha halys TaxID=286706 RepID=UPI0006D4DE2A|nr:uncharacterized protein LOC106689075 [Halyomorpha halys]
MAPTWQLLLYLLIPGGFGTPLANEISKRKNKELQVQPGGAETLPLSISRPFTKLRVPLSTPEISVNPQLPLFHPQIYPSYNPSKATSVSDASGQPDERRRRKRNLRRARAKARKSDYSEESNSDYSEESYSEYSEGSYSDYSEGSYSDYSEGSYSDYRVKKKSGTSRHDLPKHDKELITNERSNPGSGGLTSDQDKDGNGDESGNRNEDGDRVESGERGETDHRGKTDYRSHKGHESNKGHGSPKRGHRKSGRSSGRGWKPHVYGVSGSNIRISHRREDQYKRCNRSSKSNPVGGSEEEELSNC